MPRWVLLRHDTPDGTWHYDWMLEPGTLSPHPDAALITFRVFERPDDPSVGRVVAERLADHRRVYLTYEGEVSGNRGTVRRVAEGEGEVVVDGAVVEIRLDTPTPRVWRGVRVEGGPAGRVVIDFRAV